MVFCSRTTQEELDEETAALQREAEMSVEDLKKLYSKIEQQVSLFRMSLVLPDRHDDMMTHVWLKSENGDDESQNEQAEVESSALPTILADLDEEDDDTDDVDYKEWVSPSHIIWLISYESYDMTHIVNFINLKYMYRLK